mgnify:CR=1 FL=1
MHENFEQKSTHIRIFGARIVEIEGESLATQLPSPEFEPKTEALTETRNVNAIKVLIMSIRKEILRNFIYENIEFREKLLLLFVDFCIKN